MSVASQFPLRTSEDCGAPANQVPDRWASTLYPNHDGGASHPVVIRLHTTRVEMSPRRSKVRALSFGFVSRVSFTSIPEKLRIFLRISGRGECPYLPGFDLISVLFRREKFSDFSGLTGAARWHRICIRCPYCDFILRSSDPRALGVVILGWSTTPCGPQGGLCALADQI